LVEFAGERGGAALPPRLFRKSSYFPGSTGAAVFS